MTRALRAIQSSLVILTLVLFGSVAHAEKQKMAVLGIEATVGANGKIDPDDTKFAKALTKELKARAQLSAQYSPVKEDRELVDEKLMNNCGSEQPSCMAPIGQSMNADVVLFGNIKNAKGGWVVNLKLHSVGKKSQLASDPNVFIPVGESTGAGLSGWVKDRMRKLTGETAEGMVIVKIAGSPNGSVLVNNQVKDTLKSGQATLTLSENRYTIGVDADGFKLWEQEVTVSADKPVTLSPELTKKDKKDPDETKPNGGTGTTGGDSLISRTGTESSSGNGKRTAAKVVAGVALVGAAASGAYWIYSWRQTKFDLNGGVNRNGTPLPEGEKVGDGNCGEFESGVLTFDNSNTRSDFESACSASGRTDWLWVPTVGLGLVGVGALAYVMITSDSGKETSARGRQKKRKNLIVTPVITPDGTGATLRFDW